MLLQRHVLWIAHIGACKGCKGTGMANHAYAQQASARILIHSHMHASDVCSTCNLVPLQPSTHHVPCAACQALKQKLANRRKFVPWGDSKPFSVPTLPAGLLKQPVLPLPEPKPAVSSTDLHAHLDATMVPCLSEHRERAFDGHLAEPKHTACICQGMQTPSRVPRHCPCSEVVMVLAAGRGRQPA